MPPHNDGTGESHIVLLGEDPTLCELREAGREPSKKKRLPEDGFDTDEECSKILVGVSLGHFRHSLTLFQTVFQNFTSYSRGGAKYTARTDYATCRRPYRV
jgi:hypothetical protein